ncbi:MAG TPA: hypothetical protein VHS78_00435 [Candidatus Elarobacter sp.]|nr:hypothetical protein [Candidatus Elarobacter sp.]
MRVVASCFGAVAAVVLAHAIAIAQTASPSPAPSASASPSPRPGTIRWSVDAHTTFVSSAASGPGITPPEAAGFANGSPLSPLTPYDVFSSAPLVSGNASESALYVRPSYAGRTFDVGLVLGAGYVRGSVTNAAYWGEPLFAPLNPHIGSQRLPYRIVFPTHAGQDDGTAFVASVLSGSIATKDGNLALRAGWFDLAQTAQFVFVQPAVPNAIPAVGIATPETLGDGPPALDAWQSSPAVLPLHGVDLVGKRGLATVELTDASLPALPGTPARMHSASLVIDHGEGTKYVAHYLHVSTGGDLVDTTVLYGADGTIVNGPQGPLPESVIGGQRQTIVGVSAAFHAANKLGAVVKLARSAYDAGHVAEPGTSKPGTYAHLGVTRALGGGAGASLDLYRNEAYYANALLPYGVPENVWSVAWSWPGQWLKSNYQLINDFPVNIDRQGYRAKVVTKTSALDVRAAYGNFAEIEPITFANALRTGFIDGFFLPEANDAATLGRQQQYLFYAAWHPRIGDLTLDYAEDTMRRPAALGHPNDTVSYDNPEAVLTFTHRFGARAAASLGLARYGMRGTFGQSYTNVDFAERIGFAGIELAQSPHATALLSYRRTAFAGIPSILNGPSPNFTATTLIVEQRYKL